MGDVREMLLQHILTKDIFLRVFDEDQFHRENNVAQRLDTLEQTFFTGDLRRNAIDRLRAYYGAIGRAADEIADYSEKQQFIKGIYEDFYKAYNPAAADRLGVVYTPNEVVDFIIRGVDSLLQWHFGRRLADDNVQILDPATGTGTFITNLIKYLPPERLEYKYLNEMHANEIAILPYYIANLNIEYSYKVSTGYYREFPNLCLVDTLNRQGATGGAIQPQGTFNLGALSEENRIRVQEQNEKSISVIVGNPPYNDSQSNWNEFNHNRQYPEIDKRIRDTYVAESTAQKTHRYDMYKRFIRWASDRLADDGIIGFITDRAYIDARQDDGFRQVAAQEFTDIYILDLGSDVRRNPRISGTAHNVLGIQTGVAIGFFVRDKAKLGECSIQYAAREDIETARDKLAYLRETNMGGIGFEDITPDKKGNWLNQSNTDFESLMPLAVRRTKSSRDANDEQAVFNLVTNAVKSNRDDWVYDFDARNLRAKALFFADTYNGLLDKNIEPYDPAIKWSEGLRALFQRGQRIEYDEHRLIPSLYRPFVKKHYLADAVMSDRLTRNHYEMFGPDLKQPNRVINFCVNGKDFYVLATDKVADFHLTGDTQCLPLYRYTKDGERVSNITDWAMREWGERYRNYHEFFGGSGASAEDVFAYVYGLLHDPAYRHYYRAELLWESPRLPLYHDVDLWLATGRELLDLHLGFESAEPYGLERRDQSSAASKVILRADKERGIITLDDKTALMGVPPDAWRYRLGSRSALEWVLDQYKERKPKDQTIATKFNTYRFADHNEQVIDLLQRVCTVSVKTMDLVDSMAYWWDDLLVAEGDRGTGQGPLLWSRSRANLSE